MTDQVLFAILDTYETRITELVLQVAALRGFLEETGVSRDAFAASVAKFQTRHIENFEKNMAEWRKKKIEEQLRRLLEEHEGTVQ